MSEFWVEGTCTVRISNPGMTDEVQYHSITMQKDQVDNSSQLLRPIVMGIEGSQGWRFVHQNMP